MLWIGCFLINLLKLYAVGEAESLLQQAVWADSRWYGPAVMSNGQDGHFKGIIMDT